MTLAGVFFHEITNTVVANNEIPIRIEAQVPVPSFSANAALTIRHDFCGWYTERTTRPLSRSHASCMDLGNPVAVREREREIFLAIRVVLLRLKRSATLSGPFSAMTGKMP